jgi:hypothetical protein
MLDAHPQLAIPFESYFITGLYPFRRRYLLADGRFDLPRFARDLSRLKKFRDWDLSPEALRRAFGEPAHGGFPDAIRLLYRTYADAQGKPRYGDKSPGYVTRMKLLLSLFPEARFVHIVRDPRAVALSLVEMPREWGTRTVPEGAARWRHRVGRGHREGMNLGPQRYVEVRYEDLVADPERTLRAVLAFLLLPWDDAVLQYGEGALSRVPERQRDIHRNVARAPAAVRDWRGQITSDDLAAVEIIAGDVMEQLGYEREVAHPTPEAEARAEGTLRDWQVYLRRKKRKGRLRRRLQAIRPGASGRG